MAAPAPQQRRRSWFTRFKFDEETDSINDARNVLLIIAALITTVTFQAGVAPPGGVWQEGEKAGRAIYSSQKAPFYAFLVCNTLAYSTSILVLISLTYSFPYNLELWAAIAAMSGTYVAAVFAISPEESPAFRILLVTAAVPFIIRTLVQIFRPYFTTTTSN